MKVALTDAQKRQLNIQHDSARDGRIRDRIKAVIQETTVARHINDYLVLSHTEELNGPCDAQIDV